jgi:alpha-tubulin suppressor-like RCC1 family protein
MIESKIVCWGSNQHNILSLGSAKVFSSLQTYSVQFDIIEISASEKHVSFITSNGAVYSYGLNLDGRLGVGGKSDLKYTFQNPIRVQLSDRAIRIKCGFSHVCVMLENKQLYSWGLGDYGSLGIG